MAKIRTIKPEFHSSEQVVSCTIPARLLFIGLWNFCDDGGVHPYAPLRLKMQIYPNDTIDIQPLLDELFGAGLIGYFESAGKEYIRVLGRQHQKIDKPSFRYPQEFDKVRTISAETGRQYPPEGKGRERDGEKEAEEIEYSPATAAAGSCIGLARTFLSKQRGRHPKESAWQDLEGCVMKGAENLRLFVERPPNYALDELQRLRDWIPDDEFWRQQIRTLGGIRKRGKNGSLKLENAMAAMRGRPQSTLEMIREAHAL